MSIAFSLLLALCGALPLAVFLPPPIAQSGIGLLAAILLALAGISARSSDVAAFERALRRVKWIAALPAVWIVWQLMPQPVGNATIWASMAPALNRVVWGHITVDIGDSFSALLSYLSLLSLWACTVLLSVERARARAAFVVLRVAIPVAVFVLLLVHLSGGTPADGAAAGRFRDALTAAGGLGLIVLAATPRERAALSPGQRSLQMAGTAVSVALCLAGLVVTAHLEGTLAAAAGLIVYALIALTRRAGIGGWMAAGGIVVVLAGGAAIVSARDVPAAGASSSWIRHAANPAGSDVAQRALDDAGPLGTGAGTYRTLMPIYADLGRDPPRAPTAAVALAIQLGWPFVGLMYVLGIVTVAFLIRAALFRRRDWQFAAAASACLASALLQAFCDASLLNYPGMAAVTAIVFGVGVAQSFRRSEGSRHA